MESDPPTEPSTKEDSPGCWGIPDDRLKVAMVFYGPPGQEKPSSVKVKQELRSLWIPMARRTPESSELTTGV